MTSGTVSLRIPPEADHVPLLRTLVAGVAARAGFTLDEVDDLRMGVEEAAVLLLRHDGQDSITLDLRIDGDTIEADVRRAVPGDVAALDRRSFSWTILNALADEVRTGAGHVVLVKRRTHHGAS